MFCSLDDSLLKCKLESMNFSTTAALVTSWRALGIQFLTTLKIKENTEIGMKKKNHFLGSLAVACAKQRFAEGWCYKHQL